MIIILLFSVLYKCFFVESFSTFNLQFAIIQALNSKDFLNGFEHQLYVGEEAEAFDVFKVILHLFGKHLLDIDPVGGEVMPAGSSSVA